MSHGNGEPGLKNQKKHEWQQPVLVLLGQEKGGGVSPTAPHVAVGLEVQTMPRVV